MDILDIWDINCDKNFDDLMVGDDAGMGLLGI